MTLIWVGLVLIAASTLVLIPFATTRGGRRYLADALRVEPESEVEASLRIQLDTIEGEK